MKKIGVLTLNLLVVLVILTGCKGSKEIQGTWQTTNSQEVSAEVVVHKDTIEIADSKEEYEQNGLGITNGIKYFTISLNDESRYLTFVFPTKNKDIALLIESESLDAPLEGKILLAMNRKETPSYEKYVEKYGQK